MNPPGERPYRVLMQNQRDYEILLLRDLHSESFQHIADKLQISSSNVNTRYRRVKRQQVRLYADHLLAVLGPTFAEELNIFSLYRDYGSFFYVSAYFEKHYSTELAAYRAGEPGLPEAVLVRLPPRKQIVSGEVQLQIVRMREEEQRPFAEIGRETGLTRERAAAVYSDFYHQKWRALCKKIAAQYGPDILYEREPRGTVSSKTKWEQLLLRYPEFADD